MNLGGEKKKLENGFLTILIFQSYFFWYSFFLIYYIYIIYTIYKTIDACIIKEEKQIYTLIHK